MGKKIPVTIISGFLGAGKTTLIQKLLEECFQGERIFLLENEFGRVGIDGSLLSQYKVEMREIYSGCICCSLKGDFTNALIDALDKVKPQRILIEPTGVGKLSEIISVLEQSIFQDKLAIDQIITVVDAQKSLSFLKNFGEFFKDQVRRAKTLILSKTQKVAWQEVQTLIQELRILNSEALCVTTPWNQLTGTQILSKGTSLEKYLNLVNSPVSAKPTFRIKFGTQHRSGHSGVAHTTKEAFQSWSWESPKVFKEAALEKLLSRLEKETSFGTVIRAKGFVPGLNGWLHFEYVSGDWNISTGSPQSIGRAVVIGQGLQEERLKHLFGGAVYEGC
ncbi:cobalamin synthesis protein P47K [Desulfofarcimen acetoxidans DSM 771]|uniref:Cobalamin synthesis protein P47K n=1 Tax=Desulfofarcimen acetoxidans (strain ATCC 49208 / DSM 771 / KCTC 5769 / VKM B-1644 / 5575) TaxID=485916 RepID=C8W437_DESAS|nr:CobW family GTP-binding protein [Desulfofarcimen acetoxidans]ACV61291.1 cobalamin synthesis protein P47K [Desulfofarcimen acetoxidans DSM 771]